MKKSSMARGLLSALWLCVVALNAGAEEEGRVSREREALRRAQSALRAATEQQGQLQADKARLTQDNSRLEALLKAEVARGQAAIGRLKQAEQRSEGLQTELGSTTHAQKEQEAAAQQRERDLQQQLQAARREAAEHLQSARALSALLERSTQALNAAEEKNHKLYAIGQELVRRYQGRTAMEVATIGDPVLGLTAVRLEDQAEGLRTQLEQQRVR